MSKYNLVDIFEQYRIGSGWTNDFDYEGMLNAGLKIETDTPLEVMKKISDDFEGVNYHRENNHLQGAIDALEAGDVFDANGKLNDFRHEIKKTMATFDMDMSDDLGAYMASKMDLDEGDAVDLAIEASQEKAGIKEDKYDDIVDADNDIPADKKKAAAAAYRKVDKGASYKKATSHIKEVRIDREVADRIESMLSIPLKAKFLDAFDDVWEDLTEEDMFYPEDVINHLNNEMHKRLNLSRTSDPKPEEIPMFKGTRDALDDISIREEDKGVDFIRALKVDANGTSLEIKSYLESLKRSGDKFDSVDDYVEDFKNYVADKSLQEHFKRFK